MRIQKWLLPLMALGIASPALADKLPKKAVPMASADIAAFYAGNTAVWSKNNAAFFTSDGVVKGYFKQYWFVGKWTVTDNKICMANQVTDSANQKSDGKTYTDCWEFYAQGKKYYSFYTNDHEKKTWDRKNGWDSSEFKNLKTGDKAATKYLAMGGK